MKTQSNGITQNKYDTESKRKLLLIISIVGIIGAAVTLMYSAVTKPIVILTIVQLISVIVYGTIIVLLQTRGWVKGLSTVVVIYTMYHFIGSWMVDALANHITRVLLVYLLVVIVVLLEGRGRIISLGITALLVAIMVAIDVSSITSRQQMVLYMDLMLDSVVIGGMIIALVAAYKRFLVRTDKTLYEHTVRDPMTGAFNIRYFTEQLAEYELRWTQGGLNYSTAILDIDRFKMVNDTYGHEAGNRILRLAAEQLRSIVGDTGIVSRYGGDEFIVLVSGLDANETQQMMSAAQNNIAEKACEIGIDLSLSAGVCDRVQSAQSGTNIQIVADKRMYTEKERRRQRRKQECSDG